MEDQHSSTEAINVSDREMGFIALSVFYAIAMPGVGVPNHNFLTLIDKLSRSHNDPSVQIAVRLGGTAAQAYVNELMKVSAENEQFTG